MQSPRFDVLRVSAEVNDTMSAVSIVGTNESNEARFVESGRVMGISRKDL